MAAFSWNGFDCCPILIEKIEHDAPDSSEVLGGVARSGLIGILSEGCIQDPVAVVLDLPVCTNDLAQVRPIRWQTTQVVTLVGAATLSGRDLGRLIFNDDQAAQAGPSTANPGIHPIQFFRGHQAAKCLAIMSALAVLVNAPTLGVLEFEMPQGEVKMINRFPVQSSLVSFEGKEVVCFFGDDFFGKLPLGAHRVDGDGVAFEIEQIKDALDGRDFVFLFGNVVLAERDTFLGRSGAHHVDGLLFESVAAAQTLAVDGDDLVSKGRADGGKVGA